MAQCAVIDKSGKLILTADTPDTCAGYVLLSPADYGLMVQSYQIAPADVLYVFSWGFGAVLFFWSLGFAVGAAKKLISLV